MSSAAQHTTFTFETVRVDRDGDIIERQAGAASCLSVDLGEGIELELVAIPGGTFMMGDDRHHHDERPIHQVTISPFYLGKYPITQAQYRSVMGDESLSTNGDYPIEAVNWDDARTFCDRLSHQTGDRYTLPSEAQWEYACRAGTHTAFHFGETITPDLVNYNGDYPYGGAPQGENRAQATPVGSFPPNAFGLYDMHGNVWEWCLDEYQPSYQDAPSDGRSVDTGAPAVGSKRVMRGGAWDYVARGCRSAVRCSLDAGIRIAGCGLRVVLVS